MNHSITHIAFKHLSYVDGMAIFKQMIELGAGEYTDAAKAPRNEGVMHGDTIVKSSHRMIVMAAHGMLDGAAACSYCGVKIDGFALVRTVTTERAETEKFHTSGDYKFTLNLVPTASGKFINCDHILPQFFGGADTPENFQLSCEQCNCKKRHTVTDADLGNLVGKAHAVVKVPTLFSNARALIKKRNSVRVNLTKTKKTRGGSKKALYSLDLDVESMRKVIKFLHSEGISIAEHKKELVEKANNGKIKVMNEKVAA